jgi:hypothetical protein
LRLLAATLGGGLGAAFRDFRHAGKFQSQSRACLGKAIEIALGQFLVGAGLHPAHGMYGYAHSVPAVNGSVNRFFLEIRRLPHLFEIVEVADFGAEDMDDDIA